jgi:hypothetical protein
MNSEKVEQMDAECTHSLTQGRNVTLVSHHWNLPTKANAIKNQFPSSMNNYNEIFAN